MTGHIGDFDSVSLLTPIPADDIAVSHLPAGEGLKNGDEGAVVDAMYWDRGWVTVEFFRNVSLFTETTQSHGSSRICVYGVKDDSF